MTLALLITAATGAWAAITTEDIGKVICTDGSLYATKIMAQEDGKTAVAMIGYVDTENNKALAIALTDGPNNKNWTQACEYCTGLNTSLPVANGTWVLPTEEQWKSVLTLEEVGNFTVYKSESLNAKLNAAKGNALDNESAPYWSATELSGGNYARVFSFYYGMGSDGTVNKTNTDGMMTRAFLEIELSGIEVTTNAEEGETTFTEASFQMPAYDATAEYELVRDMSIQMTATMGDGTNGVRYRVKKAQQGQGYEPADLSKTQVLALVAVNDGIEQKALTLDQDYFCRIYKLDEQTLLPEGDGVTLLEFDFAPGLYALKAFAQNGSDYAGETPLSNTFKLFQGYEVQVAAKEFITYYKDEALYVEDEAAELYTIQSVNGDQAVLSDKSDAMPSNTPMLVYNKSNETKVILLIPCAEPDMALTVAPEFQGTLTATTIAASTDAQTNYAFNGKQFVYVKNAIEVGPNKAWLSINTGVPSARITLVFEDETTGVSEKGIVNSEKFATATWYDLNGRKLDKMPTKKGIYIKNGKKVVVK